MEKLNLKQYRKMVEEILDYKKKNGKMPDYVVVEGFEISKKEYINMIERVNKFILEMGRNPRTVDIKSSSYEFQIEY
ncbi:MAG TPA: pseudomurein-binding repeat-containing protein [Methanobacterium sp.]|nr:pseudomurein-binding repeat-containing protein [Methanobacterium sp.]